MVSDNRMVHPEVIVKVGAEGGDITLLGLYTNEGWVFIRKVFEQMPTLVDEPSIQHRSGTVGSWPEALGLLGRYPWHRLHPLTVHPEFHEQVWEAVVSRFKAENEPSDERLDRWKALCGRRDA